MDAKEIGAILRKLREEKKETKRHVAKTTGCSYASICAYEYGNRIPCDEVKVKLASHFGTTVEKIFFANQ